MGYSRLTSLERQALSVVVDVTETTYIDVDGLTQSGNGDELADALGLTGSRLRSENERLEVLSTLRESSGLTVITGPLGASWWCLVSPEVKVKVVPDDYEYAYRTRDVSEWSLRAVNLSEAAVKELTAKGSTITRRHGLYASYIRANNLAERINQLHSTPIIVETHPVTIITDVDEQINFLNSINEFVAVDGEWTVPEGRLVGISVSTKQTNTYLAFRFQNSVFSNNKESEARILLAFGSLLERAPAVLHNLKADVKTLYPHEPLRLSGKPLDDTLVMAYLCGESDLALKPLTRKYLDRDPTEYPGDLENLPLDLGARYATADTRNTYDLYWLLKKRLDDMGQTYVYEQIERPLVPVIASMERNGSVVDIEETRQLRQEVWYAEEAMRGLAQGRWHRDISDDTETREAIKQQLGYDPGTLDQRVLSKVPDSWMDVIIGYRKLRTLRRNFLDKHLDAGIGRQYVRSYPSFNQAGQADSLSGKSFKNAPRTGRLSSSNPNFMNQPRLIRNIFVAPKGYKLATYDYSGLEMRIQAALSKDPTMLEVFRKGGDMHSMFQERIYDLRNILVDRVAAKQGNFNLAYGGEADMLMTIMAKERAHITYDESRAIVDAHHETYSGYHAWKDSVVAKARQLGYTETLRGRRRYDADINALDPTAQRHAERALANHVIQGTAADLVKEAMVRLVPVLLHYGAYVAVQVHDELVMVVSEDKAEEFDKVVKVVMQSVQLPGLSLEVSGGIGDRWSDTK